MELQKRMETGKIMPGGVTGLTSLSPSGQDLKLTSLSSATLFIVMTNVLGELVLVIYFLQKSRKSCSTLLYLLLLVSDLVSSATGIFACFSLNRYQQSLESNGSQLLTVFNKSQLLAAPDRSRILAAPDMSQILAASDTNNNPSLVTPKSNQNLATPTGSAPFAAPNSSVVAIETDLEWNERIRVASSIILGISSRFSTLVFCTLSLVRFMVIIRPFFNVERKQVVFWLSIFLAGISFSMLVVYFLKHFSCSKMVFSCVPAVRGTDYGSITFNLAVFQIIPNVIPCLLILVVAINAFIYYLRKTSSGHSNSKLLHSCLTVILYSATFTITTLPYIAASFSYYLNVRAEDQDDHAHLLNTKKKSFIFLTLFLYLRSLLTILVFATRSSGFRNFIQQIKRRNLRVLSFVNPELDQAIQRNLKDKEFQDKIRRHVNSNPAVRDTAVSVRWDRKVRIHKVGTINEVASSSVSSPTLSIRMSPLPTISENSE